MFLTQDCWVLAQVAIIYHFKEPSLAHLSVLSNYIILPNMHMTGSSTYSILTTQLLGILPIVGYKLSGMHNIAKTIFIMTCRLS